MGDQTVVSHLSATDYVGNLRDASGSSTLSLSSATVTTGQSTGTVQYHDYGQFRLKAGAVRDSAFAGGDASNGDCIVGSTSNTLNGGKYGCDIANQADTALFGRFYPSHFAASGALTPACVAGNMTYAGQPFVLTYSVTAMSFPNPQLADATTMTRYSAGTISVGLFNDTSATDLAGSLTPSPSSGVWLNGVFMPSATDIVFARAAAPSAPLDKAYAAIRATTRTERSSKSDGTSTGGRDVPISRPGHRAARPACTHKKVAGVPTAFRYGTVDGQRLWSGEQRIATEIRGAVLERFAFIPNTLDRCGVDAGQLRTRQLPERCDLDQSSGRRHLRQRHQRRQKAP